MGKQISNYFLTSSDHYFYFLDFSCHGAAKLICFCFEIEGIRSLERNIASDSYIVILSCRHVSLVAPLHRYSMYRIVRLRMGRCIANGELLGLIHYDCPCNGIFRISLWSISFSKSYIRLDSFLCTLCLMFRSKKKTK